MPERGGEPEEQAPKRKRRRWKRWVFPLVLVAGLVVLDGPGWRWIAGRATGWYFPKLGLAGTVNFAGRLSGGEILLEGVKLDGTGALQQVDLDRLVLRYRPSRVIHGELEAVEVSGVKAVIDLDKPWPQQDDKPKEKTDLTKLGETLRKVRAKVVPIAAEISDVKVEINRGKETVFHLATADLEHGGGADDFRLKLGEMAFPGGKTLPAQETTLRWTEESLRLDRADLMPGLGLRDVNAELPAGKLPEFSGDVLVKSARFAAAGTLEHATVRLAEGSLTTQEVAELIAKELPAEGRLTALQVEADGFQGGLETLGAKASARLESIAYEDWQVPVLELKTELAGTRATLDANLEALDSPVTLAARADLKRGATLEIEKVDADFTVPQAGSVLTHLRERYVKPAPVAEGEPPAIPAPVPVSNLAGKANATFEGGRIAGATVDAKLSPADPAAVTAIALNGAWKPQGSIASTVVVDGLRADATIDPTAKRYGGKAAFQAFTPDRLRAWLLAFGVKVPPGMTLDGAWQGGGPLGGANGHEGKAEIAKFSWTEMNGGPLEAGGSVDYAWPTRLEVRGLHAVQGAQKINADVRLQDRVLVLQPLSWTDGADVLVEGKATVPVPENPADWKNLLKETRPLALDFETRELALSRLHAFLPASVRFTEKARGQVVLHVSGTPAEPVIEGKITGRDLGVLSQKDVPKGDLDLAFRTTEGRFAIEGTLTTPGYPAAELSANIPFRPGEWAERPESLKDAPLAVRAYVPNLDLSRFAALVPTAKTLRGNLMADVTVAGTVGKPEPLGKVELKNGFFELKSGAVPPIDKITLSADATPAAVRLQRMAFSMDGGTFDGRGGMVLKEGKPGDLDITLRGRALPVKRDDSMVIRGNVDLTIRGPWESATVGGTLGIVDSLFYRDIELLPIGVPFNQPSEPKLPSVDAAKPTDATAGLPEPFRDWKLAVNVRTANPFLVRGNLATGEVYLNVNVGGTVGKPEPRGSATLREVSAKLPFSTLFVEQGTVDFRPDAPFDPTLNIRGRSLVRPYEVNLYVYGPVSDPKILTTSNPPLPESEIMTLLATGTTTRGIEDPQAAMTRGVQLLVEELRRGRVRYAKRLQPLLKLLDRVDFQIGQENQYSGQKYNSATINLDDHWLVNAGMSADEGRTRVMLMYLIRFR